MKHCEECGKKISFYSIKCKKCYQKTLKGTGNPMFGVHRTGKKSPRYIDGRSNKKGYCIDCGKEISGYEAKRCSSCAMKYLHKNGIYKNIGRHLSEQSKRKISLTKGGTGVPYEFNKYPEEFYRVRYWIFKRDNHICQNCNITEKEYLIIHNRKLEIHHIDYNKQNSNENNLITLCRKCNMGANHNRTYWRDFYKNKIGVIYGNISC